MNKSWKDIKKDSNSSEVKPIKVSYYEQYKHSIKTVLTKVYYKTLMNIKLSVPACILITISSYFFYYFNVWTRPFAYFT